MAKVNDLMRLIVIRRFYSLTDFRGSVFFSPSDIGRFQITFGEVNNKTGLGRVALTASLYILCHGTYKYKFYGIYNHILNDCEFKSVEVDRDFFASILLSINDNQISRSWLLEEEEEGGDVHAVQDGACPAEVVADVDSDSSTKYCTVNSTIL